MSATVQRSSPAATLQSLASAPANPALGNAYFDTTENLLKVYVTVWQVWRQPYVESANVGDASYVWAAGGPSVIVFASNLTAGRTVTLGTAGVTKGTRVTVRRTGGGIGSLTVNSGSTISGNNSAEYVFDGTAWKCEQRGANQL